jgi:hypothetical protein
VRCFSGALIDISSLFGRRAADISLSSLLHKNASRREFVQTIV